MCRLLVFFCFNITNDNLYRRAEQMSSLGTSSFPSDRQANRYSTATHPGIATTLWSRHAVCGCVLQHYGEARQKWNEATNGKETEREKKSFEWSFVSIIIKVDNKKETWPSLSSMNTRGTHRGREIIGAEQMVELPKLEKWWKDEAFWRGGYHGPSFSLSLKCVCNGDRPVTHTCAPQASLNSSSIFWHAHARFWS